MCEPVLSVSACVEQDEQDNTTIAIVSRANFCTAFMPDSENIELIGR